MSEAVALTDDDILRFTQGTRKKLIDDMLVGGMPNDNKDRMVLLTALADMDRTALGNKKIGAAESIAESDRIAAQAIARINGQFNTADPARRATDLLEGEYVRVSGPEIDDRQVPDLVVVDGEMHQGLEALSYDSFIKHMEGE